MCVCDASDSYLWKWQWLICVHRWVCVCVRACIFSPSTCSSYWAWNGWFACRASAVVFASVLCMFWVQGLPFRDAHRHSILSRLDAIHVWYIFALLTFCLCPIYLLICKATNTEQRNKATKFAAPLKEVLRTVSVEVWFDVTYLYCSSQCGCH